MRIKLKALASVVAPLLLLALPSAALAQPTIDGESAGSGTSVASVTLAFPANSLCTASLTPYLCCTGSGTGTCTPQTGDCFYAVLAPNGTAMEAEVNPSCLSSGAPWPCCTALGAGTCTPSGWHTALANFVWYSSSEYVSILTHVYTSGDAAPTFNFSATGNITWTLQSYSGANGCALAAGPTAQANNTASTTISGPGITGTAGDAHLFNGANAAGATTFSAFNDSLVQKVVEGPGASHFTVMGADAAIASSGAMTAASATTSQSGKNVGIEADLEASVAATPTATATATVSATATPSITATPTISATPTASPTATATATPVPGATPDLMRSPASMVRRAH